ncbi:MAG TPA: polysaccharide deacetylase family protein [Vicinamibacteria bacterium]|nr:polysaccharide deacetylase family protein [Vicinamibacteria bacterium]
MALKEQVREVLEVPRDLLLGRYPRFVTGGPLPRGQVPVFVFHSLEPEDFGRKLAHLADNGYLTLAADEYLAILAGSRPAPEKAVVLTFDDARGSLWSVGYPLLRRHGMKGVVFMVPGRTAVRSGPRLPTWDDVLAGKASPAEIRDREVKAPFLFWEEIEELARTGLFDFESHTLRHARIPTGPRVVGFLTPDLQHGYRAMDVPLFASADGDLLAHQAPLGAPLLASAPRTSEALRFIEDPATRLACREKMEALGGEAIFQRADWRRILRRTVGTIRGREETREEQSRAIERELREARVEIETRTGRPVRHLCYPWHVSGPTARRLAADIGYVTAFCGKVPRTPITLPGGDPRAIARIGEDYLELLPGRGRTTLSAVLRHKWLRRFGGRA